jgi:UBX domain-containing protein 1
VSETTANVPAPDPTPASNPAPGFRVDESVPTTSLQIRLSDGTRLVARFNTSNTIRDLRAFIDASRPSSTSPVRLYQLQTVGFPPKLLDDVSKTIEEEGIANSVIIQKV